MFPIPCCCERSVDLKIFDNKENNIKPNLIHPLTKESIRRTLSSKIRAQLKINVNNSSINGCRHHLSYHSSPRTNICALENCKKTCNEGNKKVVILSKKKMYLCSDECWGKWLQNLNKPYLNKETRKNSALINTNVNNKRND